MADGSGLGTGTAVGRVGSGIVTLAGNAMISAITWSMLMVSSPAAVITTDGNNEAPVACSISHHGHLGLLAKKCPRFIGQGRIARCSSSSACRQADAFGRIGELQRAI